LVRTLFSSTFRRAPSNGRLELHARAAALGTCRTARAGTISIAIGRCPVPGRSRSAERGRANGPVRLKPDPTKIAGGARSQLVRLKPDTTGLTIANGPAEAFALRPTHEDRLKPDTTGFLNAQQVRLKPDTTDDRCRSAKEPVKKSGTTQKLRNPQRNAQGFSACSASSAFNVVFLHKL